MKKIFATIFVLTIFIPACSSSISTSTPGASESAPTVPQVPATVTATEIPPTQTFTPVPAFSLPVGLLTPVPSSNTKITSENVQDLQEIAKYYGELNYIAKLTKDKKFLFILDPDGLTKYDYASMESMTHLALANSVSDLQISNNGDLLMLDNKWLLDLKNDKEPELQVISEKIHLLNFYTRTFSLSPDGTVIAVEQNQLKCDTCEHIFRIVSTEDFTDLYTSSGLTQQSLPTFSSDGRYFALADLLIETHSDGSSNPAGGSVGIWTTSDFTKVSSFSIKFPFYVTDIAFSEENNLIAIAQRTSIDIYDVLSDEAETTIDNLCDSYQRGVMFASGSPLRLFEKSDCDSGIWTKSENQAAFSIRNVPELSKIAFDEKGNADAIPYPKPLSNFKTYEWNYFRFLDNEIFSFNSTGYSCDFVLVNGSFDCQSHEFVFSNGQYIGKDRILGTDGKYYGYAVGQGKVDIYSSDNPGQVLYSIPFRGGFSFQLLALDPINNVVFYNIVLSLTGNANRIIIQDMTNNRIIEKWEGVTSLSSIAFSENNKFAGLCRKITNTSNENVDRLIIFDLSEKRVAYNTDFTCLGAALDITENDNKLAIEHYYLRDPGDQLYSLRTMILNIMPPFDRQFLDTDSSFSVVAYSPNGAMLAVGCGDSEICFLDSSDGKEIFRLEAHSGITNLAFSPDSNLLATFSRWGLISIWAVPPFTGNQSNVQSASLSFYNPNFYWNFNQDGNFEGFGADDWQSSGFDNIKVEDGYLSAIVTSPGTFLYSDEGLGIDSTKFTRVAIRMRVSAGEIAKLYFRHRNDDMAEPMSKVFETQPGPEFKTYVIDLGDVENWRGSIDQLRLDPSHDAVGAIIDIDYIHLLSPSSSWDFNEDGNFEGWGEEDWQAGGLKDLRVTNGYLSATVTDSGTFLYSTEGLGIDTSKFTRIEIRMRVSGGESANLYFRHEDDDLSEDMSTVFEIQPGAEFKAYVIDLGNIPSWKGIIYQLRLDPTHDAPAATIDIDYIHLLP